MPRRFFTIMSALSQMLFIAAWVIGDHFVDSGGVRYFYGTRIPNRYDWLASDVVFDLIFATVLIAGVLPFFWIACTVSSIATLTRDSGKARIGLCPTCGYDLRATPDRCPECGTATKRI
jgi:hypothetical protein